MPDAKLFFGASRRAGFAEAVAVNVLAEPDPTSQIAPVAAIARPGLSGLQSIGSAPIRALFQKNGLFSDAALVVAQQTVYTLSAGGTATAQSGSSIAGDDLVIIAAAQDPDGNDIARFATGDALYKLTLGVVSQETFPDSGNAGATSVAYLQGYWLASVPGSDFVYYLEPGGATWNVLQFAAAEYAFDRLKGIRVFGELIAMLGEETTEFWRITGDAASPIEPAGGLKFDIDCKSIHAAINCAGTLIWVDQHGSVWMSNGGAPVPISDNSLAAEIGATAPEDIRATYWVKNQHPVYHLTLGTSATWLYDLAAKAWTRATSLGRDYWRAHLTCNIGDTVLAADHISNLIWTLDPDRRDDDGDTFTVEVSARIEVPSGTLQLYNVELDCLLGEAPLTGQGSNPLIALQVCRDGVTYGGPSFRSLGVSGARQVAPKWNALGQLKGPFGGLLRFYVSDPVGRRFSAVRYNV